MKVQAKRFMSFISVGVAERSKIIYSEQLDRLTRFIGSRDAATLTTDDMMAFIVHLQNGGLSAESVNMAMRVACRFVRWLEDMEVLKRDQVKLRLLPALPQPIQKRMAVTHDQYERLMRVAAQNSHYSDFDFESLLLIGWHTGMRVWSDACRLEWGNIDFDDEVIRLQPAKLKRTGQMLEIPMTRELYERLLKLKNTADRPSKYVLPRLAGFVQTANGLRTLTKRMRRLFDEAGLPEHSGHCLRHGLVTRLVNSGVDPITIGSITGQSLVTIRRYAHVSNTAKRAALEKGRLPEPQAASARPALGEAQGSDGPDRAATAG